MRIGIPAEVKNHEYRVALTPAGPTGAAAGHEVLVQAGAGRGSAISDEEFERAGARVLGSAEEVWGQAELVCKVKEPVPSEYPFLREDLLLFAYLHLAADPLGAAALLDAGTTAVAYETTQAPDGTLPLLAPMSEVAGRMATQVGAYHLMRPAGGSGACSAGSRAAGRDGS